MKLKMYFSWEKSRDRKFLELLEYNPHARVVDLGCGNGEFTLKIKDKICCNEIFGVDIYELSIKKAKSKGIEVIKHDLNVFPYPFEDGSFDVVVSNQVLSCKVFEGNLQNFKAGGYAVLSTENLASWDNIFSLIFGYTPFSMEFDSGLYKIGNPLSPHNKEVKDPDLPPHVRILSFRSLVDLAGFIGFRIERIVGSGHIFGKVGETVDKRHCRLYNDKGEKMKNHRFGWSNLGFNKTGRMGK